MISQIPLNAFSSISVNNFVFQGDVSHPQTFPRGLAKAGRHVYLTKRNYHSSAHRLVKLDGIPPRPPSKLPPPGDRHLTLSLGERLGYGRIGSVRVVNVVEPELAAQLPKLVIKISHHRRSTNMAEEAWFYEELEHLQGISVPRCYGFFQARLHENQNVVLLNKEGRDEDEYDEAKALRDNEKEYEDQFPGQGRLVSVLVLERLGGNVPVGVPVDAIHEDVTELFNDLARYGVECLDLRWSNILSVYDDPDSNLESNPNETICPNHGHAHRWRVIDFDHCRKSDGQLAALDRCNKAWLSRIFKNLPWGGIIEPWD